MLLFIYLTGVFILLLIASTFRYEEKLDWVDFLLFGFSWITVLIVFVIFLWALWVAAREDIDQFLRQWYKA